MGGLNLSFWEISDYTYIVMFLTVGPFSKTVFFPMGCFRWFPQAAGTFFSVPVLGSMSVLSLTVAPFALLFAVLWGIYRNLSFAWIGQDVLVRTLFYT